MQLTTKQKQQLKAKAHALKPVVSIGNNGLTAAVQAEIERALIDHELIKIRIHNSERNERQQIIEAICQASEAVLLQTVGKICIIYRKRPE